MLVLLVVCVLANTFFVKAEKPQEAHEMKLAASSIEAEKPGEVLEMKQVSTSMAVSSNVGLICPDPKWSCPGTQPCCYSSIGWRCCPYTGGNCCAGGLRCCPSGQACIWNLWCV